MNETNTETLLAKAVTIPSRPLHAFFAALGTAAALASSLLAPAGLRAQVASPSAVYQPTSHPITVFVGGSGGELYDNYYNGSAWVWQSQGTPGTTSVNAPSAVYDPDSNPITVFVVGDNGSLYDKYWNGSAWKWELQKHPKGTTVFGSSAVYLPAAFPLYDFVGGVNGKLYDLYWDGSAWAWEGQGTPPGSTVESVGGAVYDPASPNPLYVFVVGANGHLFVKYMNGSTSEWTWRDQGAPPGTTAISVPTSVYQSITEDLSAFVTGANGHLFENYWNGSAWAWKDLGTPTGVSVTGAPSAVYDPSSNNPLLVFVVGSNGHLFVAYLNGTTWEWRDQGIPSGETGLSAAAGLSAIYDPTSTNSILAFAVGSSTGNLYVNYWNGTAWEWRNQAQP
jgi:hypothetical protein